MMPDDEEEAPRTAEGGGAADMELFHDPSEDEVASDAADDGDAATEDDEAGDTSPFASPRLPKARRHARRVVAVTGAKGGVGKTLLSTNLAVYLASIGRQVVLVDADAGGANAHAFLGLGRPFGIAPYVPPAPSFGPLVLHGDADEGEAAPAGTGGLVPPRPSAAATPQPPAARPGEPFEIPVPGLRLMLAGLDEPLPGRTEPETLEGLVDRIAALSEVDYVVVDLGSGTQPALVDFWVRADLGLYVTLPEPTAIENTYRFARTAYARAVELRVPEEPVRARLGEVVRALGNNPPPLDLVRALEGEADPAARAARRLMEELPFHFVVNETRLRADLELGDRMTSAALRRLGLRFDYLGYIDYDDTVWTCVRSRRPVLVESPGTKASRSIEKIARRLLAVDSGKVRRHALRTVPPESHHDLLEVDRGATDEEIRRAYKRAREIYAPDSLCRHGLFDEAGLEALRARLDEAYDVLLDPARRRPYELSVFPPDPEPTQRTEAAEHSEPLPPPPEVTPETDFTGSLLRAVRESQGVSLREVSQTTKIGVAYLRAIERDDFKSLPALVYTRGFVTEVAKVLKLDPDQVSRTYVRRYKRYLEEREKH